MQTKICAANFHDRAKAEEEQAADHGGYNGVHELNDGDFSPKATPNRPHFKPNVATTNDCHVLWDFLE